MNFAVNYYRLILPITLEAETRRNYLASELAQRFIDECLPAELLEACPKTKYIKRWHEHLWLQAQDKEESYGQRAIATTALRCYVSWRLEETAKVIMNRYQSLKPEDINLDTVRNSLLEDANLKRQYILKKSDNSKRRKLVKISQNEPASVKSQKQAQAYQPLSFEIIETWNPALESASSLDSWVRRKALSAKIMKPLGIDRHTPWYRLCKVSQRYFKLFYDHEQQHIKIFQQIYGSELHKHRSNLRDSYPDPTADQWSRMRDLLAVALNRLVEMDSHIFAVKQETDETYDRIPNSLEYDHRLFDSFYERGDFWDANTVALRYLIMKEDFSIWKQEIDQARQLFCED